MFRKIYLPHISALERRDIFGDWIIFGLPPNQLASVPACRLMTSVIHLVYLTAMPWLLLKTFNSRSASLTKLLLQNKENIMSTLSLVFKSLSGQEVFQPLSILAESVTTSFPVVKVVNFRDWAITLQKNDLNVSIDVRSTW